MTMIRTALAPALLGLLLLTACAAGSVRVTPLQGVPDIDRDGADWLLYVPSGIGKVRVVVPPNSSLRLKLYYAEGKPFETLEGVEVVENVSGSRFSEGFLGVNDDGRQRIWITSGHDALDVMIHIVDAYR